MMKKRSIICLLGLAAISLIPYAASAETQSQEVHAIYAETATPTVISVDITWGSMAFTYQESRRWNPKTHTYDMLEGEWLIEPDENQITVINHSNAEVTAELTIDTAAPYQELLTLATDKSSLTLPSADSDVSIGDPSQGPSESATLSVSGRLPAEVTADTVIGHVTVQVN